MHNYTRVLPRDLFNEAKLLKCLGALTLHIHDGILPELEFDHDGSPFDIVLSDSGELSVSNLFFRISRTNNDHSIWFYTNYNSKENYPLQFNFDDEIGYVFTDNGSFTDEFTNALKPQHAKVPHGLCPICKHYGDDCTGDDREALLDAIADRPDLDQSFVYENLSTERLKEIAGNA